MIFSQVTKPKSHRNWTETVNAPIFQQGLRPVYMEVGDPRQVR